MQGHPQMLRIESFCQKYHMNNLDLQLTTKCLFGYGADSQVTVLGQFVTKIKTEFKSVEFVINDIQKVNH